MKQEITNKPLLHVNREFKPPSKGAAGWTLTLWLSVQQYALEHKAMWITH